MNTVQTPKGKPTGAEIQAMAERFDRDGDWQQLLDDFETVAGAYYDGHCSIFRFTRGWKAFLGTVTPAPYNDDYERVSLRRGSADMYGAVRAALQQEALDRKRIAVELEAMARGLNPDFLVDVKKIAAAAVAHTRKGTT